MLTQVTATQPRSDPQQPLTKKQVADWLQVSERTIDRLRAEGRLKCFKFKGTVRFRMEWLDQLLTRKSR